MNLKYIIKRPSITEKSIKQTVGGGYAFVVDPKATKGQIKEAVEKFFGVTVVRVRALMMKGKTRKVGKLRKIIRLPDWKKAIVELKQGQKINYFETVGKET